MLSKRFNEHVLHHPQFYSKLCLLAIDECHLVEDWKGFRPDYNMLGVLRSRLPDSTPLLGLTATLDPRMTPSILRACNFRDDVNIIRTPLDRPEIFIQCSVMTRPMNGMLDLQHLLPASIETSKDIPKTIIFMETVALVLEASRLMSKWMAALGYRVPIVSMTRPFFSAMAESDKKKVLEDFGRPSEICESPRIIIATEAYGLGIDNPDISRVIQWGVPSSMPRLNQRMGRAMRCRKGQGHFTFLFPPAMVGPLEAALGASKKKRTEAESRSQLCRPLWRLMNEESPICLRKVGLEYFEAIDASASWEMPRPCCSNCNPTMAIDFNVHTTLNVALERNSLRQAWYSEKIENWRIEKAKEIFRDCVLIEPSTILPNIVLGKLAAHGDLVKDLKSLGTLVGLGWAEMPEFGSDILTILLQGQSLTTETGEVFEAWVKKNDIKSKRVEVEPINRRQLEFEARRDVWFATRPGAKAESSQISIRKKNQKFGSPVKTKPSNATREAITNVKNAAGLDSIKEEIASTCSEKSTTRSQKIKKMPLKTPIPEAFSRMLEPSSTRNNRRKPSRYAE